jgi:hypothetical protein
MDLPDLDVESDASLDEEFLDNEQVSELLRELGQASEHADEETADDFYEFMTSLTEFDLTGFLDEVV